MAASYALRLLSAVLAEQDLKKLLAYGPLDHLFELDPTSKPVAEFMADYIAKTGKLPPIEVVEDELSVKIPVEDAAAEWLYGKAFESHVQKSLRLAVEDAKDDFVDNPKSALNRIAMTVDDLRAAEVAPNVTDFKDAFKTLWPYLNDKWANKDSMASFGWPYLDNMCGGLRPGDLISLVGRPQQGKSWFMLWLMLGIWRTLKQPVVFVSMEMSREVVLERLAAIAFSMPADFFKSGQAPTLFLGGKKPKDKKFLKQQLIDLMNSDAAPFIIVDANLTGTVADVVSVVQQYKAVACGIDGAYLLEAPAGSKTHSIYEAVAVNCSLIKKKLAKICPTFASWQFAKIEKKLRKGEKPTLENIGYSDTIAQLSSIVLGLMQKEDMSSVENLMTRIIDVLKGRGGEIGEFAVNWDFQQMDFGQYVPPEKIQLFN